MISSVNIKWNAAAGLIGPFIAPENTTRINVEEFSGH
jgi:hypothetical protein